MTSFISRASRSLRASMSFRSNRSDRSKQDSISGLRSMSCLSQSVPVRQPCGESGCVEPSPLLWQLPNLGRSGGSRRRVACLAACSFCFSSCTFCRGLAVVASTPRVRSDLFMLCSLPEGLVKDMNKARLVLYCISNVSSITTRDALRREGGWEDKLALIMDAQNSNPNSSYIYKPMFIPFRYPPVTLCFALFTLFSRLAPCPPTHPFHFVTSAFPPSRRAPELARQLLHRRLPRWSPCDVSWVPRRMA